jgi:hypothetical protein
VRHLTVRNVPPALAAALEKEKRRRGRSLNQTVIELLAQGLGVHSAGRPSNGLAAQFAGTWSEDEFREFEAAIAGLEQVDEELWR